MDQQQHEMEKLREEAIAARIQAAVYEAQAPKEAVSDEQLAALQARLEALHAVELFTDEEFFVLEDICAEFVELQSTSMVGAITKEMLGSGTFEAAAKVHRLATLSEKMAGDAGFARQARRKHVVS